MSFIETIPEEDIEKLAQRLNKYIQPNLIEETSKKKKINTTYSVNEISKITGKHKHTIRNHIKINLLQGKKIGKSFIVTQENLTKYIENEK